MRLPPAVTVALLVPALFGAGCAGLDTSARSEGTGIQIVGAVIILAKYRASQNQKAVAEAKARRAFVALALQPAYEARVRKLKRVVSSGPRRPGRPSGSAAEADPQTNARAELASIADSWKETAENLTRGRYAGDFSVPGIEDSSRTAVQFPRLSESQVLAAGAAYVPAYLAVSVPAEQSVPGSRDAIMLWNTRTHQLASETVYAVDRTPSAEKRTEIDSLPVQYAAGE